MKQFRHIAEQVAQLYNVPPGPAPREEMWARVRLARDYGIPDAPAPRDAMWARIAEARAARRPTLVPAPADAGVRVRSLPDRGSRRTTVRRRLLMAAPVPALIAASTLFMLSGGQAEDLGVAEPIPALVSVSAPPAPQLLQYAEIGSGGQLFQPIAVANPTSAFGGYGRPMYVSLPASDPPTGIGLESLGEAYRRAAISHLSRSEAHLAAFAAHLSPPAGASGNSARELLANTRLLLNSPVATDARVRKLLQDLELAFVRISQLRPAANEEERARIEETLRRTQLITRIRSALPAR